eukprot:Blabericola_migrator_1__354@NODE_108_length_14046_cov_203_246656_g96_i0_p4_GENE_NODE_108_length_14046_cov_203_246656_g96_i0NODE_108_length_14046_cov_203_246656_g96_i0_p4_ORF_typecomplete_len632_score100_72SDA1/PF05285_12/0_21YL1/PF05764_13/1_2_NODE_108_length_14046_cov_203_246656_g96_i065348429
MIEVSFNAGWKGEVGHVREEEMNEEKGCFLLELVGWVSLFGESVCVPVSPQETPLYRVGLMQPQQTDEWEVFVAALTSIEKSFIKRLSVSCADTIKKHIDQRHLQSTEESIAAVSIAGALRGIDALKLVQQIGFDFGNLWREAVENQTVVNLGFEVGDSLFDLLIRLKGLFVDAADSCGTSAFVTDSGFSSEVDTSAYPTSLQSEGETEDDEAIDNDQERETIELSSDDDEEDIDEKQADTDQTSNDEGVGEVESKQIDSPRSFGVQARKFYPTRQRSGPSQSKSPILTAPTQRRTRRGSVSRDTDVEVRISSPSDNSDGSAVTSQPSSLLSVTRNLRSKSKVKATPVDTVLPRTRMTRRAMREASHSAAFPTRGKPVAQMAKSTWEILGSSLATHDKPIHICVTVAEVDLCPTPLLKNLFTFLKLICRTSRVCNVIIIMGCSSFCNPPYFSVSQNGLAALHSMLTIPIGDEAVLIAEYIKTVDECIVSHQGTNAALSAIKAILKHDPMSTALRPDITFLRSIRLKTICLYLQPPPPSSPPNPFAHLMRVLNKLQIHAAGKKRSKLTWLHVITQPAASAWSNNLTAIQALQFLRYSDLIDIKWPSPEAATASESRDHLLAMQLSKIEVKKK